MERRFAPADKNMERRFAPADLTERSGNGRTAITPEPRMTVLLAFRTSATAFI